jgi:hypothetical protein
MSTKETFSELLFRKRHGWQVCAGLSGLPSTKVRAKRPAGRETLAESKDRPAALAMNRAFTAASETDEICLSSPAASAIQTPPPRNLREPEEERPKEAAALDTQKEREPAQRLTNDSPTTGSIRSGSRPLAATFMQDAPSSRVDVDRPLAQSVQ